MGRENEKVWADFCRSRVSGVHLEHAADLFAFLGDITPGELDKLIEAVESGVPDEHEGKRCFLQFLGQWHP